MKLLKKAQVGGLQGFILSIVTVAIVLAVGLIIISELRTVAKEIGDATSAINETVVLSGGAGSVSQSGELFISLSEIRNSTMNVHTNDCNVSSVGGLNCNATACEGASGTCFVDYTHFTSSAAFNSTGTIITKLATVPTWLGIIIIVALAFIVLSFFIGKRQ